MIKYEGSYEGFKIKIKGFFPSYQPLLKLRTDIQFSTPFCFACYCLQNWSILKKYTSFEILRTSAYTWTYLFFLHAMKHFCNFFLHFFKIFLIWDRDFQSFITPLIFYQIQLPRTVLNAELNQLSETVIGINIWPGFDGEINVFSQSAE